MILASVLLAGLLSGPPVSDVPLRAPDLVDVAALDPTIKLDVRYATPDNVFGRRFYSSARVFLQRPAAEALVRAHRRLRGSGFGLLVFDAYRPWSVTRAFWDATPPASRIYVADPAKGSKHNRGCAVDLTLYELASGREVEMPGRYDEMSERSHATYAGGPARARELRDLLRDAMEREGFFVYPWEWWHFDYKDWLSYPVLDIPFEEVRPVAGAAVVVDLETARIVDLSHPFDEKTLYWPTSPSTFRLERLQYGETPGGWFYASNSFCAPEHGGTHLDAPIHFARDRWTVERIPPRRLVAPAVVLDLSERAAADPDFRLTPADVARFEARFGRIPAGAIVLLRTGWSARWPDRRAYFGDDRPGDASALHFPGFGAEAATLLVRERGVSALGLDTPSLDHGPSRDFVVHRIASEANVLGLENLTGLEHVPPTGAWVVALPMSIAGGSGAPLRAIAILP